MAWTQHGHSSSIGSVDTVVASPVSSPMMAGYESSEVDPGAFHPLGIENRPPPRRPGIPARVPVPVRTSVEPASTPPQWSATSTTSLNAKSHGVHWSIDSDDFRKTSDNAQPTHRRGAKNGKAGRHQSNSSWIPELVCLLVAVASVGAIVGVLARHEGKALPSWPHSITLNALIALLATVANASLALPLSSGLSQLKWIWFRTRRAPLSDMELFDEASRGTMGAALLLVKLRGA